MFPIKNYSFLIIGTRHHIPHFLWVPLHYISVILLVFFLTAPLKLTKYNVSATEHSFLKIGCRLIKFCLYKGCPNKHGNQFPISISSFCSRNSSYHIFQDSILLNNNENFLKFNISVNLEEGCPHLQKLRRRSVFILTHSVS